MTQIAIVTSTNVPQGDMVLRGVYGRMIQKPADNGIDEPVQIFSVAPELRPVSSIFSYLDNGSMQVQIGEIELVEVADQDVTSVQDQLMYELQKRWRGMYKSLTPSTPGVMSAVISGEARQVENAINAHFAGQGKSLWRVPVQATMQTGQDGAYLLSASDLLKALDPTTTHSVAMIDAPTTQHVDTDGDLIRPATPADPDAPTPAWCDYQGVEAQVQGHIVVVAAGEEDARQAVRAQLALSQASTGRLKIVPSIVPSAVIATRQLVLTDAVIDADDGDDDLDDRDDDADSPRNHYRF